MNRIEKVGNGLIFYEKLWKRVYDVMILNGIGVLVII